MRIEAELCHGEEKERQTLFLSVPYLQKMPQVGELSPEAWCELCRLAELSRAPEVGLRMLAVSGSSCRRLAEKLDYADRT